MNTVKAEKNFRRAWARVTAQVKDAPVLIGSTVALSEDADLVIMTNTEARGLIEKTGCMVLAASGFAYMVKAPTEWVSAPTRDLFALTPEAHLKNTLLEAGVADWIGIWFTDDGMMLEVEFMERPADTQIDALKAKYEVIAHNGLTYTFSERTTEVPTGIAPTAEPPKPPAPAVTPPLVETVLRRAWSNGHGGKIERIERTDDPRVFVVYAVKPIPANASLGSHGVEQQELIDPKIARVRLSDKLWNQVIPPAPEPVIEPVEPPLPDPEPPVLDERDVEIAALKAQLEARDQTIETLQASIRALTPTDVEYMTVSSFVNIGAGSFKHPELTKAIREGWTMVYQQYVVLPKGDVNLLTTFKKEPPKPAYTSLGRTWALAANGNGHHIADALIDQLDREIEPEMNRAVSANSALLGVFGG